MLLSTFYLTEMQWNKNDKNLLSLSWHQRFTKCYNEKRFRSVTATNMVHSTFYSYRCVWKTSSEY